MIYEFSFTHVVHRQICGTVEANNEGEALEKARGSDWIESNEDDAPEEGFDCIDWQVNPKLAKESEK